MSAPPPMIVAAEPTQSSLPKVSPLMNIRKISTSARPTASARRSGPGVSADSAGCAAGAAVNEGDVLIPAGSGRV